MVRYLVSCGGNAYPFERNAKVHFIRLQAANDARNLDDMRQFTTTEMYAELQMDMAERSTALQHTEVRTIEAQVTAVAQDADRYWVSVRFTGVIRDHAEQIDESFDETWNMTKPINGNQGWLLAGIEQTQVQ